MAKNWFEYAKSYAPTVADEQVPATTQRSSNAKSDSKKVILPVITGLVTVAILGGAVVAGIKILGEPSPTQLQQATSTTTLSAATSTVSSPTSAAVKQSRFIGFAGNACSEATGAEIPASFENVSGAVVAFEQAYMSGNVEEIVKAWSPSSNMRLSNWEDTTAEFKDASWCLQLEPETPGQVNVRLAMQKPGEERKLYKQTVIGEFVDGRWLIKEMQE